MANFATVLEFDLWSTTRVPTAGGGVPRGVFVDEDGNPQISAGGRTLGISRFGDLTAADIVARLTATIGVEGEFGLILGADVAKGAQLSAQVGTAKGVTAIAGDFVGAIALEVGTNGTVIRVRRVNYKLPGNTTVLTGVLTGVVDGAMVNVAAAAAATAGGSTPSAAQVDAGIATAVAPIVTGVNEQLKELETKLNVLIANLG